MRIGKSVSHESVDGNAGSSVAGAVVVGTSVVEGALVVVGTFVVMGAVGVVRAFVVVTVGVVSGAFAVVTVVVITEVAGAVPVVSCGVTGAVSGMEESLAPALSGAEDVGAVWGSVVVSGRFEETGGRGVMDAVVEGSAVVSDAEE